MTTIGAFLAVLALLFSGVADSAVLPAFDALHTGFHGVFDGWLL